MFVQAIGSWLFLRKGEPEAFRQVKVHAEVVVAVAVRRRGMSSFMMVSRYEMMNRVGDGEFKECVNE